MSDNKYNEVATKKMCEVLGDKNMDAETKAKAIRFCIDCGADVNADIDAEFRSGRTVLMWASECGNKEIVEMLLEKGADIEAKDDIIGNTALMCASRCGNKEIVEMLLEKGADIEARNDNGETALMLASVYGNRETVEMLLEKGADIEAEDNYGEKVLMKASERGIKEIVEMLLEKGADVNARNAYAFGETALIIASRNGNKEIVEMLLEEGADVNAGIMGVETALHAAAEEGCIKIVELLIEKGADVNAEVLAGVDKYTGEEILETPLDKAKNKGYKVIVEILENKMQELKAKEEMKKKIEAIKENKLKKEQVEENKFTKMTKGEMYRLDIDKLPEVSLCGEINVKLADYKKDLEALQNGEMLTFGRTDDEPIETDRGEKLVSFEDKSNYVSRKHLSVVNFGGNLYMQDRSTNGTGMREVSKTNKAQSFIKPMDKEMLGN